MSKLTALLKDEAIARATRAAEDASCKAEAAAIVKGIHEALAPDLDALLALNLKGDYGRSQPVECDPRTPNGIRLRLGGRISSSYLHLTVYPRDEEDGVRVFLWRECSYPYKDNKMAIFPGHTPPAEMVERFFLALMTFVADDSAKVPS